MEMKNESNGLSHNFCGETGIENAKQLRADAMAGFIRQAAKKLKAWKVHKQTSKNDFGKLGLSGTTKPCH